MKLDREVAGLTCGQVLEHLPDYLDDGLSPEVRRRLEAHLAGCDVCERFGGSYRGLVVALREQLGAVSPLDDDVEARLARHLDGALSVEKD